MRDKYANKGTISRFFHKYTGLITFGVIIGIISVAWYVYESEAVFFESWGCEQIMSMPLDELAPKEYLRYEEIKAVCLDMDFNP